ncbi:uncharacterized protein LOC110254547 isoform X2 [Exaiptasia diaphana]|uniref:Uncharacterized protein n=1 Tax=Exaiptasia diaphana TaxID=2652724 RepID=A0A913YBH2_EXADI|nr:uncharacterized protein LOC110254547 isoform X1 [Exaiptasia diaphana]XP_020917214.1 uncharacterized protein LOC110254547 isoform X2 [Exaiptasia diaphana]
MAKRTTFKRVLLLFSEENLENADKLRTVIESESNGDADIVDLVDIQTRRLNLENELESCDCIILISSPRTTELIDNEQSLIFKAEGGTEVNFDGKTINQYFQHCREKAIRSKVIPVSFIDLPRVLQSPCGRKLYRGHICFGIEKGKVTERMLEGDMLQSLIALIRGKR